MTSRYVTTACIAAIWLGSAGTVLAMPDAKTLDASDNSFMQHAAADGMAEVQMGQMALSKSSNSSVKQLAQQLVDDHTKANDQLKALATSKQVTLPTAPDADAQKESKKLAALNGNAFDKAWSKDMVDGHKKAVKLFTDEGKKAKDDDLRKFAQSTLPVLQNHLQMATQVASIPDARDKAMDQAVKSMGESDAPAAAAPATTTPATIPTTSATKTTGPAPTTGKTH